MTADTDNFAMNQVGQPDTGNPHVRFDERGVETESDPVRNNRLPRHSEFRIPAQTGLSSYAAVRHSE